MALRDHLQGQDARARELQKRLDELAAEYTEQMRAYNTMPLPVVDVTGEYWEYQDWRFEYDGGRTHYTKTVLGCRTTGVLAWPVTVRYPHPLYPHEVAISTFGTMLLTERTLSPGSDFVLKDYDVEVVKHASPPPPSSFTNDPLLGYDHIRLPLKREWPWQPPRSWRELRERGQHNILIDWAERAHNEGLAAVCGPIETAMLHAINQLRKR